MSRAFVLVNTDVGHEKEVVQKLMEIEGVSEAYQTYGQYDIIAKVEADTREKVKEIVLSWIRTRDDVRSSLTLVVSEP